LMDLYCFCVLLVLYVGFIIGTFVVKPGF
jgi:hypothetical protein